jgi:hypothetical protein
MAFFRFMSSPAGRVLRGVVGGVLFLLGILMASANPLMIIAIALGFVVMSAGVLDFCIFAPLARKPFMGPKLRDELNA